MTESPELSMGTCTWIHFEDVMVGVIGMGSAGEERRCGSKEATVSAFLGIRADLRGEGRGLGEVRVMALYAELLGRYYKSHRVPNRVIYSCGSSVNSCA